MSHLFSVEGKKALVTGGSAGLGRAMAEALVEGGAWVAIVGRSERVFAVAEEIGAVPLQADLADREQALAVVDRAVEALSGLDILVNNAGVQCRHSAEEFPLEDWDHVLAVNLDAVWILAQAAGRYMLKQGHGKIINVASANSFLGGITIPAYTASKGGVAQLTKALSNEWAGHGINVNAIAPGFFLTEQNRFLLTDERTGELTPRGRTIIDHTPMDRFGDPEDLIGTVFWLLSPGAAFVHGVVVPVDGGFSAFSGV